MAEKTVTKTLVIEDAPPKPESLRLTLTQRSLWEKFLASTKGLTPEKIMEALNKEKQLIMNKVKAGGRITQEECDFLNKDVRTKVEKILNDFKKRALAEMEIKT